RGYLGVRTLGDAGDFVPVEAAVEPDAEPAAVSHVRRDEEPLRVRLDERPLQPLGPSAPDREAAVAVAIRHHHDERPLAAHKEGRRAMTRSLARLRKSKAECPDPPENAFPLPPVDHRLRPGAAG